MKKIIYTIGFLMFFSAALMPGATFGQDDQFSAKQEDLPFTTARLFSKLIEATGANPNATAGQTFGETNPAEVGQNLYITIYNKTEMQPERQAHIDTARAYGVNDGDLVKLLNGNYQIIVDQRPGLTQEQLQLKISEIQQEFALRKELLALQANIRAQVESNEIFANGDLGDSGFDVIHDLTLIEELLFLRKSQIDVGRSYTAGNGLSAGQTAAQQQEANSNIGSAVLPLEDGAAAAGPAIPAVPQVYMPGGEIPESDGQTSSPAAPNNSLGEEVNPNVCIADNEYLQALADYEAQKATNGDATSSGDTSSLTANNQNTDSSTNDSSTFPNDTTSTGNAGLAADPSLFPQVPQPETPPTEAAEAANWSNPLPCTDAFCLEVNFVEKPAVSTYQQSDNCIACHVDRINTALSTVVSHTLVPSKAPGNLGEAAQCKKAMADAFGAVSMNFYAIAMPVQTPANDDILFQTNTEQDWLQFCQQTAFFPLDTCKPAAQRKAEIENGYTPPPALTDRATKLALSHESQHGTQTDLAQRIDSISTTYRLESLQNQQLFEQQQAAGESLIAIQPLLQEMDQMNMSFYGIQNIIHSLHEKVDGIPGQQACTVLKNKKECT